ncbi:MAG TPA: hypothetical protein VG992_02340 [Candidatus Saccharimonadales bacterium]|nr:hypothetical protein [Candidatus Saccharimonadales bacterium]
MTLFDQLPSLRRAFPDPSFEADWHQHVNDPDLRPEPARGILPTLTGRLAVHAWSESYGHEENPTVFPGLE